MFFHSVKNANVSHVRKSRCQLHQTQNKLFSVNDTKMNFVSEISVMNTGWYKRLLVKMDHQQEEEFSIENNVIKIKSFCCR